MKILERIEGLVKQYNCKTDQLPNGTVRIDVALKVGNDKFRYQWVFISLKKNDHGDRLYMNSRVGEYNLQLVYPILKKAGLSCAYSCLTVVPDVLNGKPSESFVIQAVPFANINDDLLFKIIFEVANTADFLEDTFYGGDKA